MGSSPHNCGHTATGDMSYQERKARLGRWVAGVRVTEAMGKNRLGYPRNLSTLVLSVYSYGEESLKTFQ